MPRPKRICPAGHVFHVLNRAVARWTLFEKPSDYKAFVRVVHETWGLVPIPIPILAIAVMPNHWHFVVQPTTDDQVSPFFRRLSVMHTMRYHAHDKTDGTGHLYQGRFKSFPIQDDEHLLTALRYVERNPVRANFVECAEDWPWGSAHARLQPAAERLWLSAPNDPPLPRQWRSWVNKPQTDTEVQSLRACIQRGLPFGDHQWIKSSAVRLGLESTTRPRGRPTKESWPLFCPQPQAASIVCRPALWTYSTVLAR